MPSTTSRAAAALAPNATTQIRADHTHVLATFHRYRLNASPRRKTALVRMMCVALTVHAQLEEEIFYPAMRQQPADSPIVDKSIPEHAEMKRLIAQLRSMDASHPLFDQTVMELMRDVLHHVADEETTLLPDAERKLGPRLGELGAQMFKRRMQLMAPHAGEVAGATATIMPIKLIFGALALLGAAGAAGIAVSRRSGTRRFGLAG